VRTPQVGDTIQLRGLERVIVRTDPSRDKVYFANPATHPAPEHPSREGVCAMSELQRLDTPNVVTWFLAGVRDPQAPRPGAIELGSAVFEINKNGGGSA